MPGKLMRIICNKVCAISSSLARFMANLVPKSGHFPPIFRRIVLKS